MERSDRPAVTGWPGVLLGSMSSWPFRSSAAWASVLQLKSLHLCSQNARESNGRNSSCGKGKEGCEYWTPAVPVRRGRGTGGHPARSPFAPGQRKFSAAEGTDPLLPMALPALLTEPDWHKVREGLKILLLISASWIIQVAEKFHIESKSTLTSCLYRFNNPDGLLSYDSRRESDFTVE